MLRIGPLDIYERSQDGSWEIRAYRGSKLVAYSLGASHLWADDITEQEREIVTSRQRQEAA